MYREWKKIELPRVLHMNLETRRLRVRPRNRWQDEVREDGRIVDGEGWQENVYNNEEWKKLERQGIVAFCTCQWNELIKRGADLCVRQI
jgi:hypothetical protein